MHEPPTAGLQNALAPAATTARPQPPQHASSNIYTNADGDKHLLQRFALSRMLAKVGWPASIIEENEPPHLVGLMSDRGEQSAACGYA